MDVNILKAMSWDKYNGPYKTSKDEVIKVLELLNNFGTSNNDELDNILYNDLASNVKHQGTIYNLIYPVLDFFYLISGEKDNQIKYKMLDFFDYIFIEYYRAVTSILTEPVRFSLASNNLMDKKINPEVYAFERFKCIYEANFKHDINSKIDVYYKTIFSSCDLIETINRDAKLYKNQENVVFNRISLGLAGFILNVKSKSIINEMGTIDSPFLNIANAINKYPFDEKELIHSFNSDAFTDLIWGRGSIAILSIDSYLIANYDNENKIISSLDDIWSTYYKWKDIYEEDEIMYDLDFPLYKYLLEDVTSIIFKNLLGCGKICDYNQLTSLQKKVYDILNYDLKVHTYSMLYAGIKPQGVEYNSNISVRDLYELYN